MRSSDMKKFLHSMLGVLGVVVALLLANDAICRALIFASTGSIQYKMYRLFNERPKGEIAIIGSSRAQGHFVPSVLGENVFNYGLDGSSQYETVLHLHALIARNDTAPIIVNLDPWGLVGGNLKGDYSLASNCADVPTAAQKLPPLDASTWPGIRFWGKLRTSASFALNAKIGGTKHIEKGAILQRILRNEAEWAHINANLMATEFGINDAVWTDLENVLSAPHPPIYYVLSPVSPAWYKLFAADQENVDGLAGLVARLRSYPNVQVIDLMTDALERFPQSTFFDPTHLNESGARKFSEELKTILCTPSDEPGSVPQGCRRKMCGDLV